MKFAFEADPNQLKHEPNEGLLKLRQRERETESFELFEYTPV